MVRCTTVILALGIIAVVFTPSNAWRRRRRRRCLVRHCTVSSCLDWLELVYATLRRRTDHSYAAKNCIGILWRGMCLSPTRNEKMKYRLLPCELCILMESLEQVLGVWDVKPFSDASYPKAQFVWRKSLPCKTDQGL